MSSKKIISLIGCGWLGLPLGKYLVENNYKVLGSTTQNEKLTLLENLGIQSFLLDINNFNIEESKTTALFESDIFIITIPPKGTAEDYFKHLKPILEGIISNNKNPWIIYTSSTGVYGKADGMIREDAVCNPDRPTSIAIHEVEKYLLSVNKYVDISILRLAGLVGGIRKPGRFFAGKKDLNSGSSSVNLIHLEDCVKIIFELISKNIRPKILNLCADEHPLHKDFYPAAAIKLGLEPPTYSEDGIDIDRKIIDNSHLKSLISYSFLYPDPIEFP